MHARMHGHGHGGFNPQRIHIKHPFWFGCCWISHNLCYLMLLLELLLFGCFWCRFIIIIAVMCTVRIPIWISLHCWHNISFVAAACCRNVFFPVKMKAGGMCVSYYFRLFLLPNQPMRVKIMGQNDVGEHKAQNDYDFVSSVFFFST